VISHRHNDHIGGLISFLDNELSIENNLIFITNIEEVYSKPKGNQLLFKSSGNNMELDDFKHELIFCIDTSWGLCVFSGCDHNGITNMLFTIKKQFHNKKIKLIFGGLHLIDVSKYASIEWKNVSIRFMQVM